MPDIVLCTLNSSYGHCSLALRYLQANLGELAERSVIRESIIGVRPSELVEELLRDRPRIVGFGVYVWNVEQTLAVIKVLKAVRPDVVVVVGGPEVSYEHDVQEIVACADFVVPGEGELVFAELAARVLAGKRPLIKVQPEQLPDPKQLVSPYHLYTDEDISNRAIYVEASRGCPFTCEFCLSSLPIKVRQFDIDRFLADLNALYTRGVRQFRFIDRTFNLSYAVSTRILEFFLQRKDDGIFVHFEMVPDRFPERLKQLVVQFPPGALQFEIGVQTFDTATAERIGRSQDSDAAVANIRFLREHSGVHIHADLIAGLPGEDLASFGRGFNRLWAARPHEIQLGILKRLRGTPISRHDREWQMVYADSAPYEVLQTSLISFADMQRVKRAARLWDLVANRGNFGHALAVFERRGDPFGELLAFEGWLHEQIGPFVGIALDRLCRLFIAYFSGPGGVDEAEVGKLVARSYAAPGRRLPQFLADYGVDEVAVAKAPQLPARQARHLATIAETRQS